MLRICAVLVVFLTLPFPAVSSAELTDVQRLERALRAQIRRDGYADAKLRFRVNCPDKAKVRRPGRIVPCVGIPTGNDAEKYDRVGIPVLILDRRRGYAYTLGTGMPATRRQVLDWYGGRGRFCRDIKKREGPYFDAVMYWFAEGRPDRMDADGDGIPCETVYRARAVAQLWNDRLRF